MDAFKWISEFFLLATLLLISSLCCCCADTNMNTGWQCSKSDDSVTENDFQTNLKNLLDSLSRNGHLLNGFYTTSIGEESNKLYGLIQCRGDIPANDCAICSKNAIDSALSTCPKSKEVIVWFTWCILRYSTENFFGVLGQSSVAITNETNYDDSSVVSDGLSLMKGLASSSPNQPLMFQTAVLDAGIKGKRYGMAQCTRDISRSDCNLCLNFQLDTFRTTIGSKKDWEIYGISCFMWYHDHQFYFNFSTTAGATLAFPEGGKSISISLTVLMLLIIL